MSHSRKDEKFKEMDKQAKGHVIADMMVALVFFVEVPPIGNVFAYVLANLGCAGQFSESITWG